MSLFLTLAATCNTATGGLIDSSSLPNTCANQDTLTTVLSILFAVIGALAFLMIVIAGLRYIFAQGEPNSIAEAKRMLIYSAIGLIISASAFAIVNYVVGAASR